MALSFPNRVMNPEIMYELLNDLDGELVLKSVINICKQEQLYPDSNLVALIREYVREGGKKIKWVAP